jgi:hypothetical protein
MAAPRMDDFVSKIVTDPKNPPATLLLKGFIGASSEKGYVRLYLDTELSDYVEIPEQAILHSQEIPKEKSPIGGSYIWIQRDASVIHGPVVADRTKASFLEGRIMAGQPLAAAPLPQTITGAICGTIIDGCTDAGPKCPTTVGLKCPTIAGKTCPDPCTGSGPVCTHSGPNCPTFQGNTCPAPTCTHSGPNCPTFQGNTCPAPTCTHSGPNCPTFQGHTCPTPTCTQSGPNCPTFQGNTCPAPTCTRTGPNCQTIHTPTCAGPHCPTLNEPSCPFPTEAGHTCVGPCVRP